MIEQPLAPHRQSGPCQDEQKVLYAASPRCASPAGFRRIRRSGCRVENPLLGSNANEFPW